MRLSILNPVAILKLGPGYYRRLITVKRRRSIASTRGRCRLVAYFVTDVRGLAAFTACFEQVDNLISIKDGVCVALRFDV